MIESILAHNPKVMYGALTLYAISIGSQIYTNHRVNQVQNRITEQIEGKLDRKAQELQSKIEKIGTAQARMVSKEELERKTEEALSQLSKDTKDRLEQYKRDTNAQVTSVSTRVRNIRANLNKGRAQIGQKVKVTTPAPKDWKGVKAKDVSWCKQNPSKCDAFPIRWDYPLNGRPVVSFLSDNVFTRSFNLSLDLGLKVTTVGLRDREGVVENQAVFFDVGYRDERGRFKTLQHFEIKEGDGKETDVFFHKPAINPFLFNDKLSTFDFSLLLGASFAPTFESGSSLSFRTGMSIGGGIANFKEGQIRIGANAVISKEILGVGLFTTYHPKILGKHFNLAPMLGVLYDSNLNPSLQVGLSYQLY
jgi:hypothetical protein